MKRFRSRYDQPMVVGLLDRVVEPDEVIAVPDDAAESFAAVPHLNGDRPIGWEALDPPPEPEPAPAAATEPEGSDQA